MENAIENVDLRYSIEELSDKIIEFEDKIKQINDIKKQYETFKEQMFNTMKDGGIDKYTSPNGIQFTIVAESPDKTKVTMEFDTDSFKETHPELYDEFTKPVETIVKGKKSYLRVTVPKTKEED